jgi:hypothetical protein
MWWPARAQLGGPARIADPLDHRFLANRASPAEIAAPKQDTSTGANAC